MVTVIVVNWNRAEMLLDCLASLEMQSVRPSRVIVVDNGSADDSVDRVGRCFPDVDLIALDTNQGFAAANNVALRTVATPFVALLNNDAIAGRYWIDSCLSAMDAYPDAGMIASKILFYDRPDRIDRAGDGYSHYGAGILRGRNAAADTYDRQEWIFGACAGAAMYRTEMLTTIGWFDPAFFLLYEDVDLSFRAQLAGYRCRYVPEALVYHRSCATIGRDSPVSVYYGHRNLEWVYFKNMPDILLKRSLAAHLFYGMLSGLFFAGQGLGSIFLHAKRDAASRLPVILRQRRDIQRLVRVHPADVWRLFSKDRFFDRLRTRIPWTGI